MDVQAVSALLAALLILAIGTSVLLRSRSDRMYTAFAAFTFTVSAWHLCSFIAAVTSSPLMRWLSLWAAATIPPTAIRFYRIFLSQPSIGGPKRGPRVTLAWTLLAYAALVWSALGFNGEIHETTYFLVPFGVYVFGGLYRCVWDMFVQYRATSKRVERTRVGYLALGGFVATTLTLTDVLPRLGVAWPAIGNVLGILYLAWKQKLPALRIHDYVACVAPIGLFFGRLANFVNHELWGAPTNVPWAVRFPELIGGITVLGPPRHPSQLYEALLEGAVLFAILWWMFWKTEARYEPGKLVDTLIVGAYIEARSCERFYRLAPFLDEELGKFYVSLLKSEARHYQDYLNMARQYAGEPIDERVAFFAEIERQAILTPDAEFRFHSGAAA